MQPQPALLAAAVAFGDATYDPARGLIEVAATDNPIHTRIVTGFAHRTIDSIAYALALLEAGPDGQDRQHRRDERATRLIDEVVALQDADPSSPTFGVWPYWAEEPVARMSPPDWNWADFIGEYLALILYRHRARLTSGTRRSALAALARAAESIIRRDVDIDYTNIAAKGAFVVCAAGELLDRDDLWDYGLRRLARLDEALSHSGTFAEYNSPTYWHVVLKAMTGVRQYVASAEAAELAASIETTAWQHFLARWVPGLGRLTGPMARCYATDLRQDQNILSVVQRIDPEHWSFLAEEELRPSLDLAHDAVLDYRIDPGSRARLTTPRYAESVIEQFATVHYPEHAVEGMSESRSGGDGFTLAALGTSWIDGTVTLGSIAHGDTWLQRRVLLGLWAEPGDRAVSATAPLRAVTASVVRAGRAFASGSFSSVQHEGHLLWAFSLASPAGDRHIHLDAIAPDEPVDLSELAVRFVIDGVAPDAVVETESAFVTPNRAFAARRLRIRSAGAEIEWELLDAVFDAHPAPASVHREGERVTIDVQWVSAAQPRRIALAELGAVVAAGTLRLTRPGGTTDDPPGLPPSTARATRDGARLKATWETERASLVLRAAARVGTRAEHARAYAGAATTPVTASAGGPDD